MFAHSFHVGHGARSAGLSPYHFHPHIDDLEQRQMLSVGGLPTPDLSSPVPAAAVSSSYSPAVVAAVSSSSNPSQVVVTNSDQSISSPTQEVTSSTELVVGATPTTTGFATLAPAVVAIFATQHGPTPTLAAFAVASGPNELTPIHRAPLTGGDVQPNPQAITPPGPLVPALPPLQSTLPNAQEEAIKEFTRPRTDSPPSTEPIDRLLERLRDMDNSKSTPPLDDGSSLGPERRASPADGEKAPARESWQTFSAPVDQSPAAPVVNADDAQADAARRVSLASAAAIAFASLDWSRSARRGFKLNGARPLSVEILTRA